MHRSAPEFSFALLGDTGEGDRSQYAVVPPLLRAAAGTDFMVIASDVIYPTGEAADYTAKFFRPYKDYPAPIYAIPGNHDWYDGLRGFLRVFCDLDLDCEPPPWRGPLGLVARLFWRMPGKVDEAEIADARARYRGRPRSAASSPARIGRSTRRACASSASTPGSPAASTATRRRGCARCRPARSRRCSSPASRCAWTTTAVRARSRARARRSTRSSRTRGTTTSPRSAATSTTTSATRCGWSTAARSSTSCRAAAARSCTRPTSSRRRGWWRRTRSAAIRCAATRCRATASCTGGGRGCRSCSSSRRRRRRPPSSTASASARGAGTTGWSRRGGRVSSRPCSASPGGSGGGTVSSGFRCARCRSGSVPNWPTGTVRRSSRASCASR
ncbi:metallophosphoesterase family protein [Actinomadura yumaensis]|uniref:metallophosphoesterase family protein n=1 Tax=Actinomadura yumaensis TaxID=111807 RepID=UPI00360754D9